MKEKVITIKPKGITQKQWSILLLELNMIKNAWRPYGVNIEMSAPGLKRIVEWGTKKLTEIGSEEVNKYGIVVSFTCTLIPGKPA